MRLLAYVVALACLASCQSGPKRTTSDGSDPIVTAKPPPTSIVLPAADFDLAWRMLDHHLSRDGRWEAKQIDDWIVITQDGAEFGRVDVATDRVFDMDFSPDGHYLAIAHPVAMLIYDLRAKQLQTLSTPPLDIVRFSVDSAHLAGRESFQESPEGRLVVVDVATGTWVISPAPPKIEMLSDPDSGWLPASLAVFDHGKQVVAAGSDGFLHWAVDSKLLTWVPCGCAADTGAVNRAASLVALVIPDNKLSLWDVAGRRELRAWTLPQLPSQHADFQPRYFGIEPHFTEDGKWLLLDVSEGRQVWSVPEGVRVTLQPPGKS